jgi:hypothetical protein
MAAMAKASRKGGPKAKTGKKKAAAAAKSKPTTAKAAKAKVAKGKVGKAAKAAKGKVAKVASAARKTGARVTRAASGAKAKVAKVATKARARVTKAAKTAKAAATNGATDTTADKKGLVATVRAATQALVARTKAATEAIVAAVKRDKPTPDKPTMTPGMEPFLLTETEPGKYSLLLTTFDQAAPAFADSGLDGGGYAWEGIAQHVVATEALALHDRVSFDPEASMFCAFGEDRAGLEDLGKRLAALYHDVPRLTELVKSIGPSAAGS